MAIETTDGELVPCEDDAHSYDEELDDVRSVIADACEILSQSNSIRFVVQGFSDEIWPVDVATDLAVVLEQLPSAVTSLRESIPFAIDFYEQGIERVIRVSGSSDDVDLECVSRHPTWQPSIQSMTMSREILLQMFRDLADVFYTLLHKVCEDLASQRWLVEWKASVMS